MIDYLLRFDDEAQARQLCPDMMTPGGEDAPPDWNRCFVNPGIRAFIPGATPEDSATDIPGFFLWLTTNLREPVLEGEAFCILGAERETGLIIHSRLSLEALSVTHISPIMAGSAYSFGTPKTIGVDVAADALKV